MQIETRTNGRLPVVDAVQFNDELHVLRYRMQLHAPFVDIFVVCETATTFRGEPKPLHATLNLTAEEKRKYNVRIFVVPPAEEFANIGAKVLKVKGAYSGGGHNRVPNWRRENYQRVSINEYLQASFPKHLLFFSDIDEFLDPEAMRTTLLPSPHLQSIER